MRKFGTDKPEFLSFELEYGEPGKVYAIPRPASLPASKLIEMVEEARKGQEYAFKWQLDFIKEHIGSVADMLTGTDVAEIITEWQKESEKQDGVELGE